jgi:S1-C subfamily serine protease
MKPILSTVFFAFVVSALFAGSAANPANTQSQTKTQKKQKERVGWLGVSISDVSKRIADDQGLKTTDGAYVSSVVDDSPADSIGLKKGDVISSFAGRQIYDADDLTKSVKRTSPGSLVSLGIVRKGQKKTLSVVLGNYDQRERSILITSPRARSFRFISESATHGMSLMELNDQLSEYFEVPEGEGVLVKEVKKESSANNAGIKAGDILLRIGGKRVDEVSDVPRILGKFEGDQKAEVELLRKGSKKTVTIVVQEDDLGWSIYAPGGNLKKGVFAPGEFEHLDLLLEVEEPELHELHLKLEEIQGSLKLRKDQIRQSLRTAIRMRGARTI